MFVCLLRFFKSRTIYFCTTPYYFKDLWAYVSDELMWNPYQDRRALILDFMDFYYGEAAKKMLEIYDKIRDISLSPARPQGIIADQNDFLTQEEFEDFLILYQEAEKIVQKDTQIVERIKKDKLIILKQYLNAINIGRRNLQKVDRFKAILSQYLNGGGSDWFKYNLIKKPNKIKKWFWKITRLKIKAKNFWEDSNIVALMKNPDAVDLPLLAKVKLEKTNHGYKIPLEMFQGFFDIRDYRYNCPERRAMNIRARGVTRANFYLENDMGKTALIIEGQDDDSSGQTPMRISVNGKEVFNGDCGFSENGWSTRIWYLKADMFKKGKNEIVIKDMAENTNPFYRWLMISGVWIERKAAR